jgi:hypothetical protein
MYLNISTLTQSSHINTSTGTFVLVFTVFCAIDTERGDEVRALVLRFCGYHYLSGCGVFGGMHGCVCVDTWMGWMDGWIDGWMDGWVGGWVGGWMDGTN